MQSQVSLPVELAVGVGFSLFAVSLLGLPFPVRGRSVLLPFSRAISEFSYSLYLFHFPVVMLIAAAFFAGKSPQLKPGAMAGLQYAGWFIAITAGAAVFWWLFEKRTAMLRRVFRPRA